MISVFKQMRRVGLVDANLRDEFAFAFRSCYAAVDLGRRLHGRNVLFDGVQEFSFARLQRFCQSEKVYPPQ